MDVRVAMASNSWTVPGSLTVNQNLNVSGVITANKATPWSTIPGATAYTTGSGNQAPQYCVDEMGYVRLRGIIVPQATLFTLPTGARPPNNFLLSALSQTTGSIVLGQISISSTGAAVGTGLGTTWVSLDDVIFSTT